MTHDTGIRQARERRRWVRGVYRPSSVTTIIYDILTATQETINKKDGYIPSHERPGFDESEVIVIPTDWKMKPHANSQWGHKNASERLNAQVFEKNTHRRERKK